MKESRHERPARRKQVRLGDLLLEQKLINAQQLQLARPSRLAAAGGSAGC